MKRIFISPHLDDAVFSVGGWIYDLILAKRNVHIITIFAGKNPKHKNLSPIAKSIHQRWGYGENTLQKRIEEDTNALNRLGAKGEYLNFLDAIYRKDDNDQNIIREEKDFIKPFDQTIHLKTIRNLENKLGTIFRKYQEKMKVYIPLGMGNHPDHKIVRIAIERLKIPIIYYADFPYTIRVNDNGESYAPKNAKTRFIPISNAGFQAWRSAIICYKSQIPDYWENNQELTNQLNKLLNQNMELRIWEK